MEVLAADPRVTAAAIITDGDLQFPVEPMPYGVVWVLPPTRPAGFEPGYGGIVVMDSETWGHSGTRRSFRAAELPSNDEIRALFDQGFPASDAPPRIQDLCDAPGTTYYFRVSSASDGSIWGTDVYTGDSSLALAAVHAGAVKPGETAVVRVTVMRPLNHYETERRTGSIACDVGRFSHIDRLPFRKNDEGVHMFEDRPHQQARTPPCRTTSPYRTTMNDRFVSS